MRAPKRTLFLCVVCWTLLVGFSLLAEPIPGVNEPHYLGKSRHFWDPSWCARDLLMASHDAHYIFFCSFGILTKASSFFFSAVAGRVAGLFLLSVGWVTLGLRLTGSRWAVLIGSLTFLSLQQVGNLSGEWIVGGIEGKVPAWACAMLGIRYALDRRWIPFGIAAGIGVSFHPVVGAWMTLAVVFAEVVSACRRDPPWGRRQGTKLFVGAVLATALALPGIVPAVAVLRQPPVPVGSGSEVQGGLDQQTRANYIQVFGRLKHHLDPTVFPATSWGIYALLLISSGVLARGPQRLNGSARLWPIVAAGSVFAAIGVVVAWGPRPASLMPGYPWRATVLKLYPFRFIDVLLPVVVSFQLGAVLAQWTSTRPNTRRAAVGLLLVFVFAWPTRTALVPANSARADWLATCKWIYLNTDSDSLCVTPREATDFKWFAQRAEFVNHKDCPQEAAGLLEWNNRLWELQGWREASIEDGSYSEDDLRRLRELSSAEYLVTHRIGPIEPEPVYRNETYRIYALPAD